MRSIIASIAPLQQRLRWTLIFSVLVLLGVANVVGKDGRASAESAGLQLSKIPGHNFEIALYKSGVIGLKRPARRISVGNAQIADILILQNKQLYVVGKALGTTNVVVWDSNERISEAFDIEVTHDLETLKRKLYELLPGEQIGTYSSQGKLVLVGQVSNIVKMQAAMELAESFLPSCETGGGSEEGVGGGESQSAESQQNEQQGCEGAGVVNMMEVGGAQQVMLEVKVAEIARTVLKRLDSDVNLLLFGNDLQFGGVSGGATFPNALTADDLEVPVFGDFGESVIGPPVLKVQPNTPAINDKGLFLSAISGDFLFKAVIEASRQKGLAKILAEPVLTTLTGQEAEFLSGGEFPIPVAQDLGQVTIEFKEFGVGVKFLPVVLDSGHISLKLNISVSELSSDVPVVLGVQGTAGTFLIPSLTKRSAGSTVELADGQTIGIAGLISDNLRESVDKFPGLGDVPMLGPLFRSQEFQSGQTELVIFVTPHLARPIAANQVRLPTDSFIPPDDLDFYLWGRLEAAEAPAPSLPQSMGEESTMSGRFGHEF